MKILQNNREKVLDIKRNFLTINKSALSGNTKELTQYKKALETNIPVLSKYQLEAAVGLVLGDASIQTNSNGRLTRLTCQQGLIHDKWTEHLMEVFEEFTAITELPKQCKDRDIREFVTLKVKQFNVVAEIISGVLKSPFPENQKLKRQITELLEPYLTPVSIAYMFGSDGGRVNAGVRSNKDGDGKGVRLNFQSFSLKENTLLSTILNEKYDFSTKVKAKGYSQAGVQQYVVDFPGNDYELFIKLIGPYIHPSMNGRVPLPRTNKEASGTKEYVDSFLGIYLKNENYIVDY